jgi:hypothetical protein
MNFFSNFVLLLLLNVASAGTLARGIQPDSSSASMYRVIDHLVSKADTEKLCIVRHELLSKQNSQEPVIDIIAYLDNKAVEKLGLSPLKCNSDSHMIDMDKNNDTLIQSESDNADLNPTQDEASQGLSGDSNSTHAAMSASETLKVFKSGEDFFQAEAKSIRMTEAKSDQDFNFMNADISSPEEHNCHNCSDYASRLVEAGISTTFNDDDQIKHEDVQKLKLALIITGSMFGLIIFLIVFVFAITACCCRPREKRRNQRNAEILPDKQN